MYLACRHHICETIVKNVFFKCLNITTSGPEEILCKRFEEFWPSIDELKFESGLTDETVRDALTPVKPDILSFARNQLAVKLTKFYGFLFLFL